MFFFFVYVFDKKINNCFCIDRNVNVNVKSATAINVVCLVITISSVYLIVIL